MRAIPVSASGREDKITVGELCCAPPPGHQSAVGCPGERMWASETYWSMEEAEAALRLHRATSVRLRRRRDQARKEFLNNRRSGDFGYKTSGVVDDGWDFQSFVQPSSVVDRKQSFKPPFTAKCQYNICIQAQLILNHDMLGHGDQWSQTPGEWMADCRAGVFSDTELDTCHCPVSRVTCHCSPRQESIIDWKLNRKKK